MAEEKKVRLFDTTKPFQVKIISGGVKECLVRWPSDEEWGERTRRQKLIRRQVGGGKSETDVLNVESSNATLFKKIRQDEGPEYTDGEASAVIEKLNACELGEVTRVGNRFRIELMTKFSGTLVHEMLIPTEDAARKFSSASSRPIQGRRIEETTVLLEPSGEFYDQFKAKAEGYAGAVPINHKDVVVVELLYQVRKMEEELDPEE